MVEKALYEEFIEYIHDILSYYESKADHKYSDIKKDISVLEDKLRDETLYLGVDGSFSSGKSTFINSVIHKNLLPTDAVQGTTVASSILRRADHDDLEITYIDGTVKRYSQCASELLEKYHIRESFAEYDEVERSTIWDRFISWIKSLFGVNTSKGETYPNTNERIELFKRIIATEDMAKDIQYVTLFYQNDNIPYNIAMVDTPGTGSLNKRHNTVTKNAIDNICDAIVVVIPYDEPVSEELLNYININLEHQKKNCIFVVTKVELLGDKEEMPRLIRVIKKRLENGLGMENIQVIPMPTLIYLKIVDHEMQTTFLDNISEADRAELIRIYEEGIAVINEMLSVKRIEYINNKVINICERVGEKLSLNLSNIINNYEEQNRQLKSQKVRTPEVFRDKALEDVAKIGDRYQQQIAGDIGFVNISLAAFRSEIERVVDGSNTSYELFEYLEVNLNDVFYNINFEIARLLTELLDGFNKKLYELSENFKREYERCGVTCRAKSITVDADDFYEEEFIGECESMLQERINFAKYTIMSDTCGLIKKVKAFFSNPLTKHKELVLVELSAVIDELSIIITDYTIEQMKQKLSLMSMNAEKSILDMVDGDRKVIVRHINATNRSIKGNKKNKNLTQAHIDRLNEYIMLIKEES